MHQQRDRRIVVMSHESSQSACVHAYAGVLVDDPEGLVELVPGVPLAHLVRHHVYELVQVDRPAPVLVHLRDHLLDLLRRHLKPQRSANQETYITTHQGTRTNQMMDSLPG